MRNNKYSNLFNFDDYIAFSDFREDRRVSGILIQVNSDLRPTLVKQRIVQHRCNVIAVSIDVAPCKTVICCAYRPLNINVIESDLFIK